MSTRILAIETSTAVCSLALFEGGQLAGHQEYHQARQHARLVTPAVSQLMANLAWNFASLDAIAISAGPGSYTGLRIGLSAAKGYCLALDRPLIAVPTLAGLAAQVQGWARRLGAVICPLLPARGEEVYYACYSADLQELKPPQILTLTASALASGAAGSPLLWAGPAAAQAQGYSSVDSHSYFLPDYSCSASSYGPLVQPAYETADFADVINFSPYYLRDFQANKPKDKLQNLKQKGR
jgi:tRNA threonylcarbamoyladenosine biosynthesis protein TsaB